MNALKYFLLLPPLFLYGCSNLSTSTDAGGSNAISRIDSSVEYVGPNNVRLTEEQYPEDVVLMFPYISGAIFGTPSAAPAYITRVDEDLNFSLHLSEKIIEIDNAATPLTDEWIQLGLTAEPAQTRVTRIGTFPYSYASAKMIGAGGFINPASRNTMILVYVDRPCEITGEVTLDNMHYSHDLIFSQKGFHWIEVIKRSRHAFVLRTYNGEENINFSVRIENLLLI